eukprot:PITA_30414
MGRPGQADEMPLQPQVVVEPFETWALDFVGPFNPPSNQKVYILFCTDYVTKWVEAVAFPRAKKEANGQVESTNKVLEAILTRIVSANRRNWAAKLTESLWAYWTTWQNSTGHSPYHIVFGKQLIFLIEFEIKILKTTREIGIDLTEAQTERLQQLNELDEAHLFAVKCTTIIQQQRAKRHNRLIKNKSFQKGDWAFLYDFRFQDFLGKL